MGSLPRYVPVRSRACSSHLAIQCPSGFLLALRAPLSDSTAPEFTLKFNVFMSADAERCLICYIVQYFTLNHPFSRDSKANTIIQCVGYIALDVYGVDQNIFHEKFKYWVL